MEDIVQLTCPSCGGKLNVSPNSTLLTCQHCGTEHLVRREGNAISLESFARCPRCGRNDRAEKVSAIISSQTQNISSSEIKMRVVPNQYGQPIYQPVQVPKTITQSSELAKKLVPPTKPNPLPKPTPLMYPKRKSNTALIFGLVSLAISIILVVLLSIGVIGSLQIGENSTGLVLLICGLPTILTGILGLGLTIMGIVFAGKIKLNNLQASQAIDLENKKTFNNWREKNNQIMSAWQNAMERWNSLYYCHRDDCIFIPDEGTSAPLDKVKEYLKQQTK